MKFSKMSGAKVNYVDGDITKYDKFNNNYFDLIISISVLEHIKNLPLSFEKMKNLLKRMVFYFIDMDIFGQRKVLIHLEI